MPPKKAKRSKTSAAQAIVGVDAKTVDRRWRSVRGRRGGLRDFMNMPGDVIQEVSQHIVHCTKIIWVIVSDGIVCRSVSSSIPEIY